MRSLAKRAVGDIVIMFADSFSPETYECSYGRPCEDCANIFGGQLMQCPVSYIGEIYTAQPRENSAGHACDNFFVRDS